MRWIRWKIRRFWQSFWWIVILAIFTTIAAVGYYAVDRNHVLWSNLRVIEQKVAGMEGRIDELQGRLKQTEDTLIELQSRPVSTPVATPTSTTRTPVPVATKPAPATKSQPTQAPAKPTAMPMATPMRAVTPTATVTAVPAVIAPQRVITLTLPDGQIVTGTVSFPAPTEGK